MKKQIDYNDPYWWFWAILNRWKLFILFPVIIGIVGFGVAHYILPKWYRSEAEIMPMYRSGDMGGAFANMISGMMSLGGGGGDYALPMMITPSDLWEAIVKSNAVIDTLIAQYNLDKRYKQKYIEEARKALRNHIETEVTGEGILKVSFEDKDPRFAARVTNSIVNHLDRINRELRSESAGETKSFIEERLKETEIALAEAESSFVAFQKEYGAISIEDQTKVAIEGIAQVRAELLMAEVELGIAQSSKKTGHGEIEEIQNRITELRKQLEQMESGKGESALFGLKEIPELGLEYARLFRELKIQELLYEYLTQQYEQARIEEKRDVPILQVLSRADVPEKKDRPKRIIVAALSFGAALILVSLWIIGSTGIDRMKELNPETYHKLSTALGDTPGKKEENS